MSNDREIKELIELKKRIKEYPNFSDEEKTRLLHEIEQGKTFDFKTGYATIDRPWLQFFDMDKYYKMHNDNSPFLIGELNENDEIKEAKQESWINNNPTLFDI